MPWDEGGRDWSDASTPKTHKGLPAIPKTKGKV